MSGFVLIYSDSRSKILCFDEHSFNLRELLWNAVGPFADDFFVICNGKRVSGDEVLQKGHVYHVTPRIFGGKGGFGSMLRAIGAQIEKTTSREACRDLSGRRMRDVNNEKKLKEWIGKQADREREKEEKRKERMAKRRAPVQHHFNDPTYADQRGKVLENLEDALQKGLAKAQSKAGASSTVTSEMIASDRKRKAAPNEAVKTKKSREWLGLDLDDMDSEESEEETISPPTEGCRTGENRTLETETGICSVENGIEAAVCSGEHRTESTEGSKTSEQTKTVVCIPENSDTVKACLSQGDSKTETDFVDTTTQAASEILKTESDNHVDSSEKDFITDLKVKTEKDFVRDLKVKTEKDFVTDLKVKTEKDFVTDLKVKIEKDGNSTENNPHGNSLLAALPMPVHSVPAVQVKDENMKKDSPAVKFEQVDLSMFDSFSELEALGLDHLKAELLNRGLKCGGTLQQRAERLFSVKGLQPDQIDPSLFSKPQKGKAKNKK
ncbi:replication stress response regulator SDE2-like [Gigantopelta aegis]|uniref:replication stress response regulator SDE2-like n=1 Tax=Gigantopelta aegis TaxID=1735272 RepID=UPI001B88A257|nr:replication stress response regulator SDE2-like [Gigantopelta aegis]